MKETGYLLKVELIIKLNYNMSCQELYDESENFFLVESEV